MELNYAGSIADKLYAVLQLDLDPARLLTRLLNRQTVVGSLDDCKSKEAKGSNTRAFVCVSLSGGKCLVHVVVCLFVVVDIANIQLNFAYPNIHAKKVCIYARK